MAHIINISPAKMSSQDAQFTLPPLVIETYEHKKSRYRKRLIYKIVSVIISIVFTFCLFSIVFMGQSLDNESTIIAQSQRMSLPQDQDINQKEVTPDQVVEKLNPKVPEIKAVAKIEQVDVPLLKLDYAINTNAIVPTHVPNPPSIEPSISSSVQAIQTYSLDQVDEKPAVLYNPRPAYPKGALRSKIEGQVIARVIVNSDGRVINVQILDGPYADIFRNESILALKRWRFTPGKKQGREVNTIIEVPLIFSLR